MAISSQTKRGHTKYVELRGPASHMSHFKIRIYHPLSREQGVEKDFSLRYNGYNLVCVERCYDVQVSPDIPCRHFKCNES